MAAYTTATSSSSSSSSSAFGHSTSTSFYPNKVSQIISLRDVDVDDDDVNDQELLQQQQTSAGQQQLTSTSNIISIRSNQSLPQYVKTFRQILASIGYMSINDNIYNKLRAMYPIVNVSDLDNSGPLTNIDWNLANLYKCDVYHHGCYFTTSNETIFLEHLSNEHSTLFLYCFYCTKSSHTASCHQLADHFHFNQPTQLVSFARVNLLLFCY